MDRTQPFERFGPARAATPVVVSVPHAGRDYPEALLAASRLTLSALRQLEDRHVDGLAAPLAGQGHAVVIARTARAWIDLNRSEREIDRAMIVPQPAAASVVDSPKVRGGLGLIPRRLLGAGDIYRGPLTAVEVHLRVREVYRPFHDALSDAIEAARARFGVALLLDCHSMPPLGARSGRAGAMVVIGDRDGTSASPPFAEIALQVCAARGLGAARNAPYGGGHILARHGRPARGAHALQIELCRSLYLDTALDAPGPRFGETAELLGVLAYALAEAALAGPEALAAE